MKRLSIILMLCMTVLAEAHHWGNVGPYAEVHGGASFLSIDESPFKFSFDPGFYVGGSFGYKPAPTCLRFEAEICYRQNNIQDVVVDGTTYKIGGHLGNVSYLGNVYLDVNMDSYLNLFVGGGGGYSHNKGSCSYDKTELKALGIAGPFMDQGFAYQVIAGFDYMFCRKIDIGVQYRFFCGHHRGYDHNVGVSIKRYF